MRSMAAGRYPAPCCPTPRSRSPSGPNNMTFAQTQLRQLKRRLNRRSIKHRESNRVTLSYIEGRYAIAEANRIFGFDGWDRETVASQCVWAKPVFPNTALPT